MHLPSGPIFCNMCIFGILAVALHWNGGPFNSMLEATNYLNYVRMGTTFSTMPIRLLENSAVEDAWNNLDSTSREIIYNNLDVMPYSFRIKCLGKVAKIYSESQTI